MTDQQPVPLIEQFLCDTLADGRLNAVLRAQHRRWGATLDTDDFQGEVLSRVWDRRDQFRGLTPEEFLAWVSRIGQFVAVDLHRTRNRDQSLLRRFAALMVEPFAPSAEGTLQTRDFVGWLLADLSTDERQILESLHFKQMSVEQLAVKLQTTPAAIRQRHFRAISKLRKKKKFDSEC